MERFRQKLTWMSVVVGVLLATVAPTRAEAEELVFCRPNNMVSAHAYIAEAQGYFDEQKVKVRFETATNAKICLDALLAGRVDLLFGAESAFVYVTPRDTDFKILAFAERNPETAIFYRRDRGIQEPKDLRQKRIGYLPGSCSVPYLFFILEKYGIARDEVRLTPLQPPALTQALIGGAVDAISIWEPWGANALTVLGDSSGVFREPELYSYQAVLVSRTSVIAERRGDLLKVLSALLKAESFLRERQDESIAILSQKIALGESILRSLWSEYRFEMQITPDLIGLLQKDFAALRDADRNFAEVLPPNFSSFIDHSLLQSIAPDRVRLQ